MVAQACNPSTQEVEAGGAGVQNQQGLHSKLQTNCDTKGDPVLKYICKQKFKYMDSLK